MATTPKLPTIDQTRLTLLVLNTVIVLITLCALGLLALTYLGFGTFKLEHVPAGATISINGHSADARTLRLRPGDYAVSVTSPLIDPSVTTARIGLMQTTTLDPATNLRSPDAIFSTTLGAAVNTSVAPHVTDVYWLDGNTWLVGIDQSGNQVTALHYDSSTRHWAIVYMPAGTGYPSDISKLPADVAILIQRLEAQHAE